MIYVGKSATGGQVYRKSQWYWSVHNRDTGAVYSSGRAAKRDQAEDAAQMAMVRQQRQFQSSGDVGNAAAVTFDMYEKKLKTVEPGDVVPTQRGNLEVVKVEPWAPNPAKVQVTFTDGTKLVMQGGK